MKLLAAAAQGDAQGRRNENPGQSPGATGRRAKHAANTRRNEPRARAQPEETRMSSETEIHPFQVDMPDEMIAGLRRRVAATCWPSQELVADGSQGVQLATVQELARYWATDYDWRACEARLNALPQFKTQIDGLDIHFIHVRSRYEN